MANLSVRNLDDETVATLRWRALRHGVSLEEEVRRILKREAAAPERLGDFAVRLFAPAHGEPPLELREREIHEPMDFEG